MIAALLLAVGLGAQTTNVAAAHLRAGADSFRKGNFGEALVEFKVAETKGNGEAPWYVAATLVKLNRADDSLQAFVAAEQKSPNFRDALFDYYHALACYSAKLYSCADRLLGSVIQKAGTRIAEQARKVKKDLGPVLAQEPSKSTVEWYRERGETASKQNRTVLALAYFEEAGRLAARRPDCHMCAEIKRAVRALSEPPAKERRR